VGDFKHFSFLHRILVPRVSTVVAVLSTVKDVLYSVILGFPSEGLNNMHCYY
jgi:hypothetical protein